LLKAGLGLGVSGVESRIGFDRPEWPSFPGQITISDLSVAGVNVDHLLTRPRMTWGTEFSAATGPSISWPRNE
jgi:hypothetical protein